MCGIRSFRADLAGVFAFRNPGGAGANKPSDLAWSGALTGTGNRVYRKKNDDTDGASDWDVKTGDAGTPKALNPGQT